MTVNTTGITSGPYVGSNTTDTYDYTFRIETKNQLNVYETTDLGVETLLTVDTDYTVNAVGIDGGSNITRVAGNLPTYYEWYIRSDYDETQLTAFDSQGGFLPAVHEAAMDKLTFLIQQITDRISRTLRLSDSYSGTASTELPDPVAENMIGWNQAGTGLENYPSPNGYYASSVTYTPSGTGAVNRTVQSRLRDVASVVDFGADPTGTSDSTAAIVAAVAAHDVLFFPEGNYLITPIIFSSTFKMMFGHNATLTASGTIATDAQLLTFSGCDDLIVRDIEIDVDHTAYPTVVSLIASSCTNTLISNIHCSDTGKTGINLTNCVNSTVEKCTVTDWQHIGIIATGASSQDNVIKNNKVISTTGVTHAVQCTLGTNETVINNYIEEAGTFGISLYKTSRSKAINNTVINSAKEAINAHEAPYNEIRGNNCYWSAAQSEDFGISIYTPTGDPLTTSGVIVSDNNIQNAGKSGIGVAEDVEYSLISNNVITNCNLLSAAEEHGGICLYGVGCVGNVVSNNLILDTGGNHDYGVFEWTNAGTPSLSHIHNNDITGFTGAEVKIIAADSKTDVWIDFNPTITAETGTITTIATNAGFYRVVNNSCEVYLSIDITTNGTGAGYVNATLPYTIRTGISHFNLSGREDGVSGDLLNGDVVAQAVRIRTYDNQYPGVDGASIVMSGTYAIN